MELSKRLVVRKGKFDAGHRVLNERFKCFNFHGHEYHYELKFSYTTQLDIGYAIDFKEIKRIACQFIDDYFDHGFIANPADQEIILLCKEKRSKLWVMSCEGAYTNPTAENIAQEIFYCVSYLMNDGNLKLESIKLQETVNCFVECSSAEGYEQFVEKNKLMLSDYLHDKGKIEYDDRKL